MEAQAPRNAAIYGGPSSEDDRVDAVWHGKFHVQAHWGDDLVDAFRALHWARHRT